MTRAPRRTPVDVILDWGTSQRVHWAVILLIATAATGGLYAWFVATTGFGGDTGLREALIGTFYVPWAWVTYGAVKRVGGRAFDRFVPAADLDEHEAASWRRRLTTTSWPAFFVVLALAIYEPILIASGAFAYDGTTDGTDGVPVGALVAFTLFGWVTSYTPTVIAFWAGLAITINVVRLHRRARRLDLFALGPAHAFAPATAAPAIAIILITSYSIAAYPAAIDRSIASNVDWWYVVVSDVASVLIAVAVFVLPLLGMRRRIEEAKEARVAQLHATISGAVARLQGAVESGADAKVPPIRESIAALHDEMGRVKAVSTWPWDTRTARGVSGTLLIPLVTWLITAYAGKLLDL